MIALAAAETMPALSVVTKVMVKVPAAVGVTVTLDEVLVPAGIVAPVVPAEVIDQA